MPRPRSYGRGPIMFYAFHHPSTDVDRQSLALIFRRKGLYLHADGYIALITLLIVSISQKRTFLEYAGMEDASRGSGG